MCVMFLHFNSFFYFPAVDAPCPLVEYITDADLNQPAKGNF